MKILIAGSHGMVGSAVTRHLLEHGLDVARLVRGAPGHGEIWWDPDAGMIDAASLENFDGVVHLASMPWPFRWTSESKWEMRENRLRTNRLLAESLSRCMNKPKVLICASGMGYYPSSGEQVITEDTPAGTSFLANLQRDGEAITAVASLVGIRVVHLRIPLVIDRASLQRSINQIGDGRQWMSWVGRDELASIIRFVLESKKVVGPVNAVSPGPVRNAEFATVAARVLGCKPGPIIPAFLARLLLGEMAEEFALASRRMTPHKLLCAGYQFAFPELEQALQHELGSRSLAGSIGRRIECPD